eukprot:COSAG04_NODE_3122_length_3145_cov_10.159988_1_plen_73_part_10
MTGLETVGGASSGRGAGLSWKLSSELVGLSSEEARTRGAGSWESAAEQEQSAGKGTSSRGTTQWVSSIAWRKR